MMRNTMLDCPGIFAGVPMSSPQPVTWVSRWHPKQCVYIKSNECKKPKKIIVTSCGFSYGNATMHIDLSLTLFLEAQGPGPGTQLAPRDPSPKDTQTWNLPKVLVFHMETLPWVWNPWAAHVPGGSVTYIYIYIYIYIYGYLYICNANY